MDSSYGKPLRPEKIIWDMTSPVDASAPGGLPVVFLTGYKVNYIPGGAAVPLPKTHPKSDGWWERLWKAFGVDMEPGFAVADKSGSAQFMHLNPDGSIPNFVPADFNANGKTYRQLTPDGVLGN